MTNFTAYLHWNALASARTFYRTSSVRTFMNFICIIMNKFKNQLDFVVVKSIPCCCWKSKWNVNILFDLKKWMCSCVSSMHWPPANYLTQTWKTCIKQWLHDGNLGQFFFSITINIYEIKIRITTKVKRLQMNRTTEFRQIFHTFTKNIGCCCCERYLHT